ncbi:MAG: hypothetical protein IT374_11760 [Polyangiaceae bacterium]|nr:hypothetical protein [Polyangiaceae bacterium]
MARALGLAACVAALLALLTPHDASWLVAPTSVAVSVVGAATLRRRVDWLAVTLGAPAPLAWSLLAARGRVELAAAACLALWAAPGLVERGSARAAGLPAGLVALGALLGGRAISLFAAAPLDQRLAACLFAGTAVAMASTLVPTPPAPSAPGPTTDPQDAARSSSDSTSRGSSP